MTRLTLRKGFSLQPVPGGVGHITDVRTGDALVVPAADYVVLAGGDGLDPALPEVAAVLERYRVFYVEVVESPASFYELDIEDAPTVVEIPTIAPVTLPAVPAVASAEPVTQEHAELEALERTDPGPALAAPPQEQPQEAQQTQRTEQVSSAEVIAFLDDAKPKPARASRRPLGLTLAGLTLLTLGVVATWALRPGGEPLIPDGPLVTPVTPVTTVVDASIPEPAIDAGTEEELDAGLEEPVDAGTPEPVDAGVAAVITPEPVDAGLLEADDTWISAEVQARGRVKMGEVLATADGEVTWTVEGEQRVKAKEPLGVLTRTSGGELKLTAPSVGLVMIKQPAGAVKRGAVLAEIIYFEAWAKGLVRGKVPKTSWRCEVISAAAQQKADCKISVVTPRAGGAQITVAIEARWFDTATDAVISVSK